MKKDTIEEIKEMPREDGWDEIPTIGELENWSGEVEDY